MAQNEVKVEFTGDASGVQKAGKEAEAAVKSVGDKGGKQAAGGLDAAAKQANVLRKALALAALPLAAFGAASKIAGLLNNALDPARHLRNEFRGMAEDFARASNIQAVGLRFGNQAEQEAAIVAGAAQRIEQITAALQAKLELRATTGKIGTILGIVDSPEKLAKDAENAIKVVEAARDRAIENAKIARERSNRQEENQAALRVAPNELARLELEGQQTYDEYRRRRNQEQEIDEKAHLDRLQDLYNQYYQKRLKSLKDALAAQEREILESLRRQQEAGFALGDINFSNSGTDTALGVIGREFAQAFRNHGGGM